MKFSDELKKSAIIFWEKEKSHDFILGIGRGDLEIPKFAYYLKQDYIFLIGYCRAISIGLSQAPKLSEMGFLSKLLNDTLNSEMQIHIDYCEEFGVIKESLEQTVPSKTTKLYVDHMIESSLKGFLYSMVSILPCAWRYGEIATYLNNNIVDKPSNNQYIKWINMYISDEFIALANCLIDIIDTYSDKLNILEKEKLIETFYKSSEYEYLFWTASWNME